ncbi:MAG: hypothetical protein V8S34_04135 [Lawsonibacter sp.]
MTLRVAVPIGGGGLISGVATAVGLLPRFRPSAWSLPGPPGMQEPGRRGSL